MSLADGQAEPFHVVVSSAPAPQVGAIHFQVDVDKAGAPQTGLKGVILTRMPSMPYMNNVPIPLTETAPGRYEGDGELTMAGDWSFDVQLRGTAGAGSIRIDTVAQIPDEPPIPTTPQSPKISHTVIPYVIKVLTPAPQTVGVHPIQIEVRDARGVPVDNVHVRVGLDMPGMPMVPAPAEATLLQNGVYQTELSVNMDGLWKLTIQVDGPSGQTVEVLPNWTVGTPPRMPASRANILALLGGGVLLGVLAMVLGQHARSSRVYPICLVGSAAIVVGAIGAGQILTGFWPADTSMGMKMDMAKPDMGVPMRELSAPHPIMTEAVAPGQYASWCPCW